MDSGAWSVTMDRMAPRPALVAVSLIAVALAAGACSDSEESDGTMPPLTSSGAAPGGSTTTVTATSTTTSASSDAPATTVASGPGTSSPGPASGPTTSVGGATTTSSPSAGGQPGAEPGNAQPTTTDAGSQAGGAVQLGANGLGPASFGDDAERVIATITAAFGAPTRDDGWVDPLSYGACPGDRYRQVVWNDLTLEFSEDDGQQHFIGYVYGSVSGVDPRPRGLTTSKGIGVGSTVAELKAAYPRASTTPGEAGLQDPRYAVPGELEGYLTGVDDEDLVISVEAGTHCGG